MANLNSNYDERRQNRLSEKSKHGGDLEAAYNQYGKKNFLDLSININPWGPPLKLWFTLIHNFFRIREYPQPYTADGREVLARFFGVNTDQLVLGNGAAELISQLPQLLPVKRAVVLEPTFTEYGRAFWAVGKPVLKIALNAQFGIPFEQIKAAINGDDLLFICQPNNPTGQLFKEKDLLCLLELVKAKQSWLVIDESFLWFTGETGKLSFLHYLKDYHRLLIINSLTKIGAIPGLRLGFMVAGSEITAEMAKRLEQWNVNRLAQKVLPTILDPFFLKNTVTRIKRENFWLKNQLRDIPHLRVWPWDANFYLVELDHDLPAAEIMCRLASKKILVRDCSNFDGLGKQYFRIAVGKRRQNKLFLNTLRRIMVL